MSTIRVICSKCGSKLDIRAELAGNTRRCPKCKTEFTVPAITPEDELGVEVVEDDPTPVVTSPSPSAATTETPLPSSETPLPPNLAAATDDDEDDEDYLPSFVTETAAEQKKPSLPAAKQPPGKGNDAEDDGPVLSIPKIPPPSRPKSKTFDPEEFLNDEPDRAGSRKTPTPAPATKDWSPRNRFGDDFDDGDSDVRPKSSLSGTPRDLQLPPPEKTKLSDSGVRSSEGGGTRDRAQAARELRQALKDSALKAPQEQQKAGGFAVDLTVFFSEIGLKGLGIIVGIVLFLPVLYYVSFQMLIGSEELPPLGYVTGTVTLDGAPTEGATVYFAPLEVEGSPKVLKKGTPRTSNGVTDAKGHYQLIYKEGVTGAALGKCRVWVALPPPQVALEYSLGALNTKDVEAKSQTIDFSLTSPKKRK